MIVVTALNTFCCVAMYAFIVPAIQLVIDLPNLPEVFRHNLWGGQPFRDVDDTSGSTIAIVQAKLFIVHVAQHTLTLCLFCQLLPTFATLMM